MLGGQPDWHDVLTNLCLVLVFGGRVYLAPSWSQYPRPSLFLQKPREECRRPVTASLVKQSSAQGGSREEHLRGPWQVDCLWASPSPDSHHWGLPPRGAVPSDSLLLLPCWPRWNSAANRGTTPQDCLPLLFLSTSEANQLFKKNFMKYSQRTGRKPKQKIPDILCGPVDKVQVL